MTANFTFSIIQKLYQTKLSIPTSNTTVYGKKSNFKYRFVGYYININMQYFSNFNVSVKKTFNSCIMFP